MNHGTEVASFKGLPQGFYRGATGGLPASACTR